MKHKIKVLTVLTAIVLMMAACSQEAGSTSTSESTSESSSESVSSDEEPEVEGYTAEVKAEYEARIKEEYASEMTTAQEMYDLYSQYGKEIDMQTCEEFANRVNQEFIETKAKELYELETWREQFEKESAEHRAELDAHYMEIFGMTRDEFYSLPHEEYIAVLKQYGIPNELS